MLYPIKHDTFRCCKVRYSTLWYVFRYIAESSSNDVQSLFLLRWSLTPPGVFVVVRPGLYFGNAFVSHDRSTTERVCVPC